MSALLEVAGLKTHFHTADGVVKAVDDVSLAVERGRVLGLVGESGSGKSMTGYSILGLVDEPGRIVAGSIRLEGRELTTLDAEAWRHLRGDREAHVVHRLHDAFGGVEVGAQAVDLEQRAHRLRRGLRMSRSWSATRLIAMIVSSSATPG